MNEPGADPFGEQEAFAHRRRFSLLGGVIEFASNDARLLRLATQAFAELPAHRWRGAATTRVTLRVVPGSERRRRAPPRPRLSSGAGMLFAHVDADNFAAISVPTRSALVQVSRARLAHDHHVRYELIELAALTLATRAQRLVPLHAALLGEGRRGLLVLGDSGAGKSTFALFGVCAGLAFVSEDSVFFSPAAGAATGVGNFLHVGRETLALVDDAALRARLGRARTIARRSGARKLEIDTRRLGARLAPGPLAIVATVVLTSRRARGARLLRPLSRAALARTLRRTQPYAAAQPGWAALERLLARRGGYLLARGGHPRDAVRAARALLASGRRARSTA